MIRSFSLTGAVTLAVLAGATPATATRAVDYVALGDSAAAGPLVPRQDLSSPGCLRSLDDYPSLAARALKVRSFRDVTCSSAKTTHLTTPQNTPLGAVPPQFDALDKGTDLVTLHIGANDISLTRMLTDCLAPSPATTPCERTYRAETGSDPWKPKIKKLRPVLEEALDGIHARAPHAKVYVSGYTTYLPRAGCYPTIPILPSDATYLQQTIDSLNTVIARAARTHHATYVDLATPARRHTACATPADRWVEPYLPASPAAPFHPNAIGMHAFAAILTKTVHHR